MLSMPIPRLCSFLRVQPLDRLGGREQSVRRETEGSGEMLSDDERVTVSGFFLSRSRASHSRHFTRYGVMMTSTEAHRLSAPRTSVTLNMKRKVHSSTTKGAKDLNK
jgi:hypothetical protein